MAKQAGAIFIEGTIDDLTFYKMGGKHYVRMKSSLTKKRFWKSKAFERSRESCKRFAEGNKLASRLYRMIEEEKRAYKLFCFLKKTAILLLKEGKSLIESEEVLLNYLKDFGLVKDPPKENIQSNDCFVNHEIIPTNDANITEAIIQKLKNKKIQATVEKVYACAVGPPNVIGI